MTTAITVTKSLKCIENVGTVIDAVFLDNVSPHMTTGTYQLDSNLIDTWDSYCLQIALPGVDPTQVRVQTAARRVGVTGKYHITTIEGGRFVWRGLNPGDFAQSFDLPGEVDGDKAETLDTVRVGQPSPTRQIARPRSKFV